MQIFTDTNHIENIYLNSEIMKSEEIVELYIIEKESVDIAKVMLKLGPILYRSKYHLLTMYLDMDIVNYIQSMKTEDSYYFFEEALLEQIVVNENHNKNIDSNEEIEINSEITVTNKRGKYPFKDLAKKDLENGMSITAVMKKYNCARSLIYSWKRELDKIKQEDAIHSLEEQQREKIVKGLMSTSPKFDIDSNKVFSEDDGTIYYIDYQWYIKIKECFEQVGIEINANNIWMIEKIFEEYLEAPIDSKVFEAVLRVNDINYSPGIIQNLYELYIKILEEYKNKDKLEQLYQELYDE